MSKAAIHGRKAALMFSLGVFSGSMFWATMAMLGVSAALIGYSRFIIAIRIFGSLYLWWLAFKSGHNALATALPVVSDRRAPQHRRASTRVARCSISPIRRPFSYGFRSLRCRRTVPVRPTVR
ncbi:LysE family transporter [Burkholderia sp. Bp9143]|uniref:LysE family translocator n=1 Tax=Burkholderia sp. Bp9143 TaxID=2184574 RepID=UPI002892B65E|nr:LysE family transporter [Burkholderia sp. Bp9143]